MALAISSAVAVNDSTSSYSVTVTGKLLAGALVTLEAYINGTFVGSGSTYGTSGTITGITATEVYANADGSSLSGAVTFEAHEFNADETLITQNATRSGNITINARCSALSTTSPTTGSPINLNAADPVNVIATWTRPHTAFRARLKGYVYNGSSYVLIFNRYGYGTSVSIDMVYLGYVAAMIAAMNGVSPRNFRLELYTQFNDGTADYYDVGSVNDTDTITSGVIYSFGGKIKAFGTSFGAKPIKVWSGSVWAEKPLKHWNGTSWVKSNS